MAQKITDNMKAIPIKNYDFQVDFKVEEKDVMETFLDPTENKHISILKRPATSKNSTWGTPKVPAKKFAAVQAGEMDLAVKGTANPVSEGAQIEAGQGGLPSNLFKFKSHLPSKKISENPKLALSMFRKKTISNKSGKTIQGNDPFSNTAGPEGFSQMGNLQRPQTAMTSQGIQGSTAVMVGLPSGKKLTAKGAAQLEETKKNNALKSSGTAHGLFGKLPNDADTKKEMSQRPKSAIVSSAVGFMQDLKKTKKLKPPKKPGFGLDEDEEMEPAPEFSDKENSMANTRSKLDEEDKPKVRKMAPPKKEPVKKKATEEYEEKAENVEDNEEPEQQEEEVDERDPYEKMAKKINMAKKANQAKVEEEEEQEAEDDVQEFPSEEEKEDEGEGNVEIDEDLFGNEEDYGATEAMPTGAPKGKKKERYQENEDEEQVNEIPSYGDENLGNENENENQEEDNGENADNENNGENNEEENNEDNENENQQEEDQEQKDLEEEMRQSVGAASNASSTKRFRSNMANEMDELKADLRSGDDLLSTYGGNNKGLSVTGKAKEAVKAKKEAVERKEKTGFDKAKDQFIKDTKKQAGGFVPYKYLNDLDGDTVQQQRDKVTDEITNYLRAADQKRQKKLDGLDKAKRKDSEPQETNEYTTKLESLNARLKSSLQGVKNILSRSKATTSTQNKVIEVQDIDSSPEDQE